MVLYIRTSFGETLGYIGNELAYSNYDSVEEWYDSEGNVICSSEDGVLTMLLRFDSECTSILEAMEKRLDMTL